MSCVRRSSTPALTGALAGVAISPYRVEANTAHFTVSDADFGDLCAQVRDAISFLRTNQASVEALMAAADAFGELDFATEYEPGSFTSRPISAELNRLAGLLGFGISVSGCPNTEVRSEQA